MKKSILNFTKKTMFVLALSGIALTSCKKEEEKAAPTIPSEDTFVMDLQDFQKTGKTMNTSSNWTYAAANVGIWNLILTVNLALPVASFREAFNHKGVYQASTDEWIWDYNVTAGGKKHTCALHAKESGSSILWEMRISQQGGFSDVLWYSGVSQKDGLSGSWTLNKDANNVTPYIGINWSKSATNSTAQIKYTNIIPNHAGNGGYIEYGIQQGNLNRFYNIFLKEENKLTLIEWSKENKNGKVKDEVHFKDKDYHCWDASLTNTTCN